MRNPLPLFLALPLLAGGCAYVPLAPVVAEAINETARGRGYTGAEFGPAAAEACRGRAARHGRVEITTVEPQGTDAMRVYGTIDRFAGSPGRTFSCLFRSDGNIRHFRLFDPARPR